jgi:hypothetical protein
MAGENRALMLKPVSLPVWPLQIKNRLPWHWIRTSEVDEPVSNGPTCATEEEVTVVGQTCVCVCVCVFLLYVFYKTQMLHKKQLEWQMRSTAYLWRKKDHITIMFYVLTFLPNAQEKKVWACSYVTSVPQNLEPKYCSIFREELSDFDEIWYDSVIIPKKNSTFSAHSPNCGKQLVATSCLLPVGLSSWNNSAPTRRIFIKCYIWVFFENILGKHKYP